MKTVYDRTSHTKDARRGFPPVYSEGIYNKKSFDFTVHMTPELRGHPHERNAMLRHEKREANLLAQDYSKDYAHRQAKAKDPEYLRGKNATKKVWNRLGYKVVQRKK